MNYYIVWYILLALALIVGIGIQISPKVLVSSNEEHYIGANVTRINNTCTCTWLSGWDYDSFFDDIKINNVSVGHPPVGTILYQGPCKNITIQSYEKSVRTYVTVFRYDYTE
jgi:hypothetical protein